jgi:hypothetical protein
MLTNVSSGVFLDSDSVTMLPVVSAEWNQNLFNPPYLTVAGTGVVAPTINFTPATTYTDITTSAKKPNFITKSFDMTLVSGAYAGSASYTATSLTGLAYKIITYVKTNNSTPVMISSYAVGASNQYGSEQAEVDSLGWTKIITYIGSTDAIASFIYTIQANSLSGAGSSTTVYFTVPEVYETTYFDYQNNSLWPTDAPFTYFRPGESYIPSGNIKASLPALYRKITSPVLDGYSTDTYSPVSPILHNPKFFLASSPVPVLKNVLPTDISPYKYFVSDNSSKSITAIYETSIIANKLVIKFNTIMTIPTFNVLINGSIITVDSSTSITPTANASGAPGVITLYWTGSTWTKTPWTTMPVFTDLGALSTYTTLNKVTITQISASTNTEFTAYSSRSTDVSTDLNRMHLIEISPRLEIDLTDFVQDVSIDKSLDAKNSSLPISSLNTNDARITLSGIPAMNGSTLVPIFSSQSNQASTILANMLRKNIKFYINFNLVDYSSESGGTKPSNTYIPGGVFYSDSWDENDIQDVSIQCYDVTRYLQATPVPDYVANLKSVFDVITNILDMAGFTDYDYDSLYSICVSAADPLDLSYYYCNSKDTTLLDALNQIFVAYQIGAYIDEYGIMKFLSLHNILSATTTPITISDSNIIENGFSISNKAKPGKISLRYQTPRIKQSPSLQNVTNANYKNSPSFIYTTSNDVVWQQQTIDSVGFNYISADMLKEYNYFNLNNNDLLDIFHTFNLTNNGYAFIENEIVSFVYKDHTISKLDGSSSISVSVKDGLELSSEVNKYIKKYNIGLKNSYCTVTNAVGNGTTITYTATNTFTTGQRVSINGISPSVYNISGTVASSSGSSFTVTNSATGTFVSGGEAVVAADYDVVVTPTGKITNVQRGMFGTVPSDHKRVVGNIASKTLSEGTITYSFTVAPGTGRTSIVDNNTSDSSLPSVAKIQTSASGDTKTSIYPTSQIDIGYKTYSVKFDLADQNVAAAGLFFNMTSTTIAGSTYFVELVRYNQVNPATSALYSPAVYKHLIIIYDSYGTVYSWADVSGAVDSIKNNFPKIIKKTLVGKLYTYGYVTDNAFNLKVVQTTSTGSDGENATVAAPKTVLSVFLNNVQITGWQVAGTVWNESTNPFGTGWKLTATNALTGQSQKPVIPTGLSTGTKFGFYSSVSPFVIPNLHPTVTYPTMPSSSNPASLREIHATKKSLIERSVNYFYQDREFLNGLVQGQRLFTNSPSYLMQATPEVVGINYYDVQYTSPAAVSVDILPVEYLWYYFPGNEPQDQQNYQEKYIDEYSLSYSTPVNTGFRAKMAIANNSQHMVFLHKESDDLNQFAINLNLWTHEIVAPSEPEIIEKIVDQSNASEIVQLDSEWIQSKESALKMMKLVEKGLDGFSKDVSLEIFGNPLIQVGDIITLSYSLNGISSQNYVIHSVSHSFQEGLTTKLLLNKI